MFARFLSGFKNIAGVDPGLIGMSARFIDWSVLLRAGAMIARGLRPGWFDRGADSNQRDGPPPFGV